MGRKEKNDGGDGGGLPVRGGGGGNNDVTAMCAIEGEPRTIESETSGL